MYCAYCSEKIRGVPVKQGGDFFCSPECASLASGIDPEDPDNEDLFDSEEFDDDFLDEDDEDDFN